MITYMLGYIQKESFIINFIPINAKHFKHISQLQHREMGRNNPYTLFFFIRLKYAVNVETQNATVTVVTVYC